MDNTIDQKIVEEIEKRYQEDLKANGLSVTTDVDFPKYRQLPDYLVLAVKILENEGAVFVKKFSKIEKKDEKES